MAKSLSPLTQADAQTPLWKRLRTEMRAEIEVLRDSLEKDTTPELLASIRAKIRVFRDILALEKAPAAAARRPDWTPGSDDPGF